MASRKLYAETPALEWLSAGIGLVLLVTVLGVTLSNGIGGNDSRPPAITVEAGSIVPSGQRFLVEFDAENSGGSTAAAVEIEGTLTVPGQAPETASATLDYVAANARSSGGLFFDLDPRRGKLELRALGYQEP